MSDWPVPGYDDLRLLGFGPAGEVWSAAERASGDRVALRRLPPLDRHVVAAAKAAASAARALPGAHLVRLRSSLRVEGEDVLVTDLAAGSVAVLAPLTPGQVVTAVAPVAEVLERAHGEGLVHGRLGTGSLLVDGAGRPLLEGLGLAGLHGAGPGSRGGDLADLATLAQELLGEAELPVGVRAALDGCRAGAVGAAAALSAALLAAWPAHPLAALPPAGASGSPASGARAAPWTARPRAADGPGSAAAAGTRSAVLAGISVGGRVRAVLAAVVVLVATGTIGWAWGARGAVPAGALPVAAAPGPAPAGRPSSPEPPVGSTAAGRSAAPSPEPPASATGALLRAGAVAVPPRRTGPLEAARPGASDVALDPAAVVRGLDAARASAFAAADSASLSRVWLAGSPGLATDRATLGSLSADGLRASGLRHAVSAVSLESVAPGRATLVVTEALSPYTVGGTRGRGTAVGGGPLRTVRMDLRATPGGWRIAAVGPL